MLSKEENSQIAKMEEQFRKDPKSPIFVGLAEAYREQKQFEMAEKIVREGLSHNPKSVSGIVTLARILKEQKKFTKALDYLNLVTEKKPDNILAQVLKGEIFLLLKEPKKALACYKFVLFYNPSHPMALKAISKLESLTADEYEDDLFSMEKLSEFTGNTPAQDEKVSLLENKTPEKSIEKNSESLKSSSGLNRLLSLADAFMVRQEFDKALKILKQGLRDFSHQPEIHKRITNLEKLNLPDPSNKSMGESISPLPLRDQWVREKKLERLHLILRRLESHSLRSSQ